MRTNKVIWASTTNYKLSCSMCMKSNNHFEYVYGKCTYIPQLSDISPLLLLCHTGIHVKIKKSNAFPASILLLYAEYTKQKKAINAKSKRSLRLNFKKKVPLFFSKCQVDPYFFSICWKKSLLFTQANYNAKK